MQKSAFSSFPKKNFSSIAIATSTDCSRETPKRNYIDARWVGLRCQNWQQIRQERKHKFPLFSTCAVKIALLVPQTLKGLLVKGSFINGAITWGKRGGGKGQSKSDGRNNKKPSKGDVMYNPKQFLKRNKFFRPSVRFNNNSRCDFRVKSFSCEYFRFFI